MVHIERWLSLAESITRLLVEEYAAAFVVTTSGVVVANRCGHADVELRSLIRVAVGLFQVAPEQTWYWLRLPGPSDSERVLRLFFVAIGSTHLFGVVAAGDGPEVSASSIEFGDLRIAQRFLETALTNVDDEESPVDFSIVPGGSSSPPAAEDFAGAAFIPKKKN